MIHELRPSRSLARSAILVIAAAGFAGCSDTAVEAEWTVRFDTIGGRVQVVNTPPTAGAPATLIGEEELRIGTLAEGGPTSFGRIRSIAVLEDGRIAVGDAQAEEVRIFDRDGQYLRTFGREGEGPGELRGMQGVYLHPDGRLLVPEQGNGRMSVFDADSGFVTTLPFQLFSYGFQGPWTAAFAEDGRTLVASAGRYGEDRYWNMLRIYDTDMVQLDSIPYYDYTDDDGEDYPGSWVIPMGNGRLHVQVPFYPAPHEVLSPQGEFWTSRWGAEQLEVYRWTPPGDTSLVLRSERRPAPVTRAERDSAIAEIRERLSGQTSVGIDDSRVPTNHPPLNDLSLDDRGRLWVRISGAGADPTIYDVFSRDGVHAETVSLEFAVDVAIPPLVKGDTVWAVGVDLYNVQHIIRSVLRR